MLKHKTKICDLLQRSTQTITLSPEQCYKEITVKLWGKGVVLRQEVSGAEIASAKRVPVKPGQFIISRIDARHGACGIVPDELDGAVVSNDFPVFDIDRSKLLPDYLSWLTKTKSFVESCARASEGSTNRVRMKEKLFNQIAIPLPPLEEQRRIVGKIDVVFKNIDMVLKLKQEIKDKLHSLVTSLHLNSSQNAGPLGSFLELHEEREPIVPEKEYPQVGIRGFGGGLFPKDAIQGSETKYKQFNKLYPDALVLSQVKGWEGAIAVCPEALVGYYASPEYRTFRCLPGRMHPLYLAYLIETPWFWRQLNGLTRGVGARRERVRPELFLEMPIPMPKYEMQTQILSVFTKIHDGLQAMTNDTSKLSAIPHATLSMIYNGSI